MKCSLFAEALSCELSKRMLIEGIIQMSAYREESVGSDRYSSAGSSQWSELQFSECSEAGSPRHNLAGAACSQGTMKIQSAGIAETDRAPLARRKLRQKRGNYQKGAPQWYKAERANRPSQDRHQEVYKDEVAEFEAWWTNMRINRSRLRKKRTNLGEGQTVAQWILDERLRLTEKKENSREREDSNQRDRKPNGSGSSQFQNGIEDYSCKLPPISTSRSSTQSSQGPDRLYYKARQNQATRPLSFPSITSGYQSRGSPSTVSEPILRLNVKGDKKKKPQLDASRIERNYFVDKQSKKMTSQSGDSLSEDTEVEEIVIIKRKDQTIKKIKKQKKKLKKRTIIINEIDSDSAETEDEEITEEIVTINKVPKHKVRSVKRKTDDHVVTEICNEEDNFIESNTSTAKSNVKIYRHINESIKSSDTDRSSSDEDSNNTVIITNNEKRDNKKYRNKTKRNDDGENGFEITDRTDSQSLNIEKHRTSKKSQEHSEVHTLTSTQISLESGSTDEKSIINRKEHTELTTEKLQRVSDESEDNEIIDETINDALTTSNSVSGSDQERNSPERELTDVIGEEDVNYLENLLETSDSAARRYDNDDDEDLNGEVTKTDESNLNSHNEVYVQDFLEGEWNTETENNGEKDKLTDNESTKPANSDDEQTTVFDQEANKSVPISPTFDITSNTSDSNIPESDHIQDPKEGNIQKVDRSEKVNSKDDNDEPDITDLEMKLDEDLAHLAGNPDDTDFKKLMKRNFVNETIVMLQP